MEKMPPKQYVFGSEASKKDREVARHALELLKSGDPRIGDSEPPRRDKWARDREVFEYTEQVRQRMGFRLTGGPKEDVLPPGGFSSGLPLWAIAEKDGK